MGLLVGLPGSPTLSSIDIDSPSAGTIVEIRSASTPTLSETTLLTTSTLSLGHTTLAVPPNQPLAYLLVWITHLGGRPGAYSSTISELTFQRAG